jgi:hypothetical protein
MRTSGGSLLLDNYHGSSTYTEVIHEEPTSSTVSTGASGETNSATGNIRLRLTKTPSKTTSGRRVSWTQDTVDNELMNKKKSKCCCQFQKAKNWDESSDEDENDDKDCAHCKGHKKTDFNSQREKSHKKNSELVSEMENDHDHDRSCNHEHDHDHLPKV